MGDQLPGVVVDGNGMLGLDQLDCSQGVVRSHGEVVSNGNGSQVDAFLSDQAHVAEQTGVTGQVYLLLFWSGDEEADWISAAATVRQTGTM